jgi:hypothetical protein
MAAAPRPSEFGEETVIRLPVKTFWSVVLAVIVFTASAVGYLGSLVAGLNVRIDKAKEEIRADLPLQLKPYLTIEDFSRIRQEDTRYWDTRLDALKDFMSERLPRNNGGGGNR